VRLSGKNVHRPDGSVRDVTPGRNAPRGIADVAGGPKSMLFASLGDPKPTGSQVLAADFDVCH